jgi:hypothetical protein
MAGPRVRNDVFGRRLKSTWKFEDPQAHSILRDEFLAQDRPLIYYGEDVRDGICRSSVSAALK